MRQNHGGRFAPGQPRTDVGRRGRLVRRAALLILAVPALGLAACSHPPTPAWSVLSVGCHDGVDPGVGDLRYDGPIDTLNNAEYMHSTDGSCSIPGEALTVIVAATPADATTKCSSIAPGTEPFHLQLEYGVPDMNWYCFTP